MARTRHVYPAAEVPHKWAHQTQDEARNPGGNLFFRGDTIYSYRTSWPLARIYTHAKRGKLVLSNSNRYSVTTAKHQHDVNYAVSHLPRVAVPHCTLEMGWGRPDSEAHAANIAHLEKVAADLLKQAQRALQSRNVAYQAERAAETVNSIAAYLAFFGIRRKAPVHPAAEWAAALQRAQRIENPDPASADKRERDRAKRAAAKAERERRAAEARAVADAARRTDWRLFGAFGAGMPGYRTGPVMLRVNGDEIETSQGARIPVAEAPLVWRLVERAIERGGFEPSGLAAHKIGDYALSGIDADGTLRVGCHAIPQAELRSMARQLGIA